MNKILLFNLKLISHLTRHGLLELKLSQFLMKLCIQSLNFYS